MAVLALVLERLVTPAVNGITGEQDTGETTLLADPATGDPFVSDVD